MASGIIRHETALADFDHARDDFEDAIGRVPQEALGYKPEGDDYTIGQLVAHVTSSMEMYAGVLGMMREAEFQEVRLAASPGGDGQEIDAPSSTGDDLYNSSPGNLERTTDTPLDRLELAHDRLATQLRELTFAQFTQASQVYYPGAADAYPTSGEDILGWMLDHYMVHTQQVAQMLEGWQSSNH